MRAKTIVVFFCIIALLVINGTVLADGTSESERSEDLRARILEMLPKAPEDFQWVIFRGVAMLRPLYWNEYAKGATYCTSVESVAEKGSFETGATIQIIRDVGDKYQGSLLSLVAEMIKKIEAKAENSRHILNVNEHDEVKTVVHRYRNAPDGLTPIIIHNYYQVSKKNEFINIITFETTEEKWDLYWDKEGKTIIGMIVGVPYFEG